MSWTGSCALLLGAFCLARGSYRCFFKPLSERIPTPSFTQVPVACEGRRYCAFVVQREDAFFIALSLSGSVGNPIEGSVCVAIDPAGQAMFGLLPKSGRYRSAE